MTLNFKIDFTGNWTIKRIHYTTCFHHLSPRVTTKEKSTIAKGLNRPSKIPSKLKQKPPDTKQLCPKNMSVNRCSIKTFNHLNPRFVHDQGRGF